MSWTDPDREDTTVYHVVVNHEEQYSIWPNYKPVPAGWKSAGKTGAKAECLAYVKEVWTDMTPLSLRNKMAEFARNPPPPPPARDPNVAPERSLVDVLCEGSHLVEVGLRPERSAKRFKEAIDRNYVYLKFVETRGGTELGFRLDRDASDLSGADFENAKGGVHLEGEISLDYVRVRCVGDVDLSTLTGKGRLERIA